MPQLKVRQLDPRANIGRYRDTYSAIEQQRATTILVALNRVSQEHHTKMAAHIFESLSHRSNIALACFGAQSKSIR